MSTENNTQHPITLYTQCRDYILSTWSQACVTTDTGYVLQASNGHRIIHLDIRAGSTPFLELSVSQPGGEIHTVFDGYISTLEDFQRLLELTSVQKPNQPVEQRQPISTAPLDGTTILGWWENDPDPRPQYVRYNRELCIWLVRVPEMDTSWEHCTPPTHWSSITNS